MVDPVDQMGNQAEQHHLETLYLHKAVMEVCMDKCTHQHKWEGLAEEAELKRQSIQPLSAAVVAAAVDSLLRFRDRQEGTAEGETVMEDL